MPPLSRPTTRTPAGGTKSSEMTTDEVLDALDAEMGFPCELGLFVLNGPSGRRETAQLVAALETELRTARELPGIYSQAIGALRCEQRALDSLTGGDDSAVDAAVSAARCSSKATLKLAETLRVLRCSVVLRITEDTKRLLDTHGSRLPRTLLQGD